MLRDGDYRSMMGLLEGTGGAVTIPGFGDALAEGLERHLGYRGSVVFIAEPTDAGLVTSWGSTHGFPGGGEQYMTRWRHAWPIEHAAARRGLARTGVVELSDYYDDLDRPQREFCRDFLVPRGVRQELSLHLDTRLPDQGFLTLIGDKLTIFEARDRALLMALRPHLANQLRGLLLDGTARRPPSTRRRQLSTRQLEVAELAARGLTNAAIARVLSVSLPTVKKHLVAVYRGLGVSSRAQLAARWPELSGAPAGRGPGVRRA